MMLARFDEGRSKSFYCIAAIVMKQEEIEKALAQAETSSSGMAIKEKAKVMRKILKEIALQKDYTLALRKFR